MINSKFFFFFYSFVFRSCLTFFFFFCVFFFFFCFLVLAFLLPFLKNKTKQNYLLIHTNITLLFSCYSKKNL